MLTAFPVNLRLDLPRAVVVLKRPKTFKRIPSGAPTAAETAFFRLESDTFARFDEGAVVFGGAAVCILAAGVIEAERVEPGSGGAFFEDGCVICVICGREGKGRGDYGEEN